MPRPARWPWIELLVFFAIAIVGMVFAVRNGESTAAQVPYVVAFTMFGVVGALILSRVRRNVIGFQLMYDAVLIASSFMSGEVITRLVTSAPRAGTTIAGRISLGGAA